MPKLKVGILGATSYVAQGLIDVFNKKDIYDLILLARSPDKIKPSRQNIVSHLAYFEAYEYDVIINCINARELNTSNISDLFFVTEKYDNQILKYLKSSPKTKYINFSSGAVYGNIFVGPVTETSVSSINMNNTLATDYYAINKIYTETKHRSLPEFNIIDIRLFSYFSRFASLTSHYFIEQMITAIKTGVEFKTDRVDMIRDYIHPEDLAELVVCCINIEKLNDSFDTYSLCPIFKTELVELFCKKFGMTVVYEDSLDLTTVTGNKPVYYSKNNKAASIGYIPLYTSEQAIEKEVRELFT